MRELYEVLIEIYGDRATAQRWIRARGKCDAHVKAQALREWLERPGKPGEQTRLDLGAAA